MPTNLSIKNVPDEVVEELRSRAKRNHRSLQGELMTILEETATRSTLSLDEAEQKLRRLSFKTQDESTGWVRELRDAR